MIGVKALFNTMSVLQAYLRSPHTQRVLKSKPGEKGFSLIELVVVVAVLAILAAIAIPQFTQLSDDARINSAKSIIANMYKECEFNKARTGTGEHSDSANQPLDGVTWGGQLAGGTQTCTGDGYAELTSVTSGQNCYVIMNLATGVQAYDSATSFGGITKVSGWPQNHEDCI